MKATLFSIVRFNNDTLDEWIRHHLSVGFTKIFLYDNNDGLEDYPMSDYVINMCTEKKVKMFNKRNISLSFSEELIKFSKSNSYNEYDCIIGLHQDEWLVSSVNLKTKQFNIDEPLKLIVRDMYMNINIQSTMSHRLTKYRFIRLNEAYKGDEQLNAVIERRSYRTIEQYMMHKLHDGNQSLDRCIHDFFIFNRESDELKKKITDIYNENT